MKKLRLALVVSIVCVLLSNPILAYYGARPMGMGGAFTAIADDANAPLWNPAGAALNPGFDLAYSWVTHKKDNVPMDGYFNAKWCLEAELGSPFEWIFGVGFASLAALEGARYLADHGVIKRGWGRGGQTLTEEEDATQKVEEEGQRVETMSEKPEQVNRPAEIREMAGRAAHHFFFNMPWRVKPRGYTYWEVRPYYGPREYTPLGKAQFAAIATWMGNDNLGASAAGEQRNWYALTLATGWEEKVALGTTLKYYALETPSGGSANIGRGGGVDIGAIIRPSPKISFGVAAQDVLVSDLQWSNGVVNRYQMKVNAGVAIKPVPYLTVAADAKNVFSQGGNNPTYHYGLEVLPAEGLALRAGLHDNSRTAGLSLAVMDFILDWSYLGGDFGGAHMAGVTWKF